MTTYNWTIAQLERQTDTGGVVTAHWRVSAQDGDYIASAYGSAGFTPDPTAPDFIAYDELTEADVLAWVWGSVDKAETEANLAKQIEDQKAPKTETGLPWV
jgi:hypothetical protein